MFNPDGVPDFFPGTTPDVVSLTGTELQRIGAQIRTTGVAVNGSFEQLKGCYQAPEASTLITSMRPMKLLASDFGNDIATMGAILEQFGQDMKGPYDQLQQMLDRARVFVAKCNQSPDWRSYENWVDEENSYHIQTAQLLQTLMNIQVAAANQIEAIIGGLGWWPDDFKRQTRGLNGGLGPHMKEMHGGDPETPPWGSPEEWDMPWIGDVGKAVVGVLDGLTTILGIQWLAQSTGWTWDDELFTKAFDHPPADMHKMFDAWGEMGLDTLMLLNKVPGIRQALPDDLNADMDTRFNQTIDTIGDDWSKGDQTSSVLGVLGLIPIGPTKLAGMTSKLGKLGKLGKLASKIPPVRVAVAGADKFLDFRAKVRAGTIEGSLKIPVVGAVVKGYSHIPILGKSVRLDPHVPLSRAPRIDTPTVSVGAPSLEAAHPGHIDLPTAHPTTSNHNRWSTDLPDPTPTHGTTTPTHSGTVSPTHPGTVSPIHPGTVDPTHPGPVDPTRPGSVDPTRPGTVDPTRSGSADPTRPGTVDPARPGPVVPVTPTPVTPTPVGTPPAAHSANTPGSSTTPSTSNTPGVSSRPERVTTGPGRGSDNPTTSGHTDGTSQPGAVSHDHSETQPAAHQPHPDPHQTTDPRTTTEQPRTNDPRRTEEQRQAEAQRRGDGGSDERDGAGRNEVDSSRQGDGRTDDPGRETQPGSPHDEPGPAVAPVQPTYPMQPAPMHHGGTEPSITSRLEPNRPASTTPDRPRQDPTRAGGSNERSIADALDPDRLSGRRVEGDRVESDRVESDRVEGEGLQKPQHPNPNHEGNEPPSPATPAHTASADRSAHDHSDHDNSAHDHADTSHDDATARDHDGSTLSAAELDRLPAPNPALRQEHRGSPDADTSPHRDVPNPESVQPTPIRETPDAETTPAATHHDETGNERTQPISRQQINEADAVRRQAEDAGATREIAQNGVPERDPFAGSELADRRFRASRADHEALAGKGGMEPGKLGEIRERLERQVGDGNALTETEVTSLERMLIGHDHQDVNEAFRDGDRSVEQKPVVRVATSALNKLPDFHGEIRRGIRFYSADEFARFMDRYQPGRTVTEPAFTHSARSADRSEGALDKDDFSAAEDFAGLGEGDGRVVLHIDSHHGKDLSFMRDPHLGLNEVVHGPHTRFYPTAKPYRDEHGVWHVHARDHGGPVDPTPEHLDRTAGDRATARSRDPQAGRPDEHARRNETDPERTQQIAPDDIQHLDARPRHNSSTPHRQSTNPNTRRDAGRRREANQPDQASDPRHDRSTPDPERTQRIPADDISRHDDGRERKSGTPDRRADGPNRPHNPNTRPGRDAQPEADARREADGQREADARREADRPDEPLDGRRERGTPDSERTQRISADDVRRHDGGRGGEDGAPRRRPGDQDSHHEPNDPDDTQQVPHKHVDPDATQQVPHKHVDPDGTQEVPHEHLDPEATQEVPHEHVDPDGTQQVAHEGKKEPYVASGTPNWREIIKDEDIEVQEPTERSRRGRRWVKNNPLAERFGPKEHTLDRELGLEKMSMYGDPGVPRGERDWVRYNPMDEGGKHQAALEQNVGPEPLLTVHQWKNLVNPNHAKGWVEFKMNCSAVTRAVVDIIQGRRIRIADGDFKKSPLDKTTPWPGDYDDTYEWMGVRGPGYRMDRHLPPGHPDPAAHLQAFTDNAYHSVEAGLKGRPPGTVAAICVRWAPDGGHWFAAYVDPHGNVRHLDVQQSPAAIDAPWPQKYDGQLERLEYTIREPDGDWEGANSADPQSTW